MTRCGRWDRLSWAPNATAPTSCRSTGTRRASRWISRPPGVRDVFHDLCRVSDVVWENFRPGVMARLGCAPATLRQLNPRLVVCSISAFGQNGPYREWPAFDLALQAMGGAMSLTRRDRAVRPPGWVSRWATWRAGCSARSRSRARSSGGAQTGEGRGLRPVAPRLPGLASHVRRAVLLGGRRACRGACGSGHASRRPVPGLPDAGRPRGGGGLRGEVLGRLLSGDRAARARGDARFDSNPKRVARREELRARCSRPMFAARTTAEWLAALQRGRRPRGAHQHGGRGRERSRRCASATWWSTSITRRSVRSGTLGTPVKEQGAPRLPARHAAGRSARTQGRFRASCWGTRRSGSTALRQRTGHRLSRPVDIAGRC